MCIKKNKYFALFKFEKSDFFGISFLLIIILVSIYFKYHYNLKVKEIHRLKFKEVQFINDTIELSHLPVKKIEDEKIISVNEKKKKLPKKIVDINLADVEGLKSIKGVGDVFSKRIIKYRDLLGGFYQIEQLKEVYGVDDEVFVKIKSQVKCNENFIVKRDLNTLEFKEMLKHPYFDYNEVKKIFALKNNHELNSIDIIKNNEIVSDQKFEKLNIYFKVID